MTNDTLLESIANNPKLPTPPAIALRVLDLASQPGCEIAELCKVISQDASLTGKILKTVNSAMYGLPRPVTSISRALATIGIKTTRSLVLSLSLPEMLGRKNTGEVARRYWGMSLAGAIASRELAKAQRRPDPEDDLAAGLLRDLGMVVLEQLFPEQYAKVWTHTAEELACHLVELEERYCGLNHAQVTAFLLGRWGFPREVTEAIRHHHNPDAGRFPDKATTERAQLLYFTTLVAQLLTDRVPNFTVEVIRSVARSRYAMDEAQLRGFLDPLQEQIQEFARILNVDVGRCDHYLLVLNRAAEELATLTVAANRDLQQVHEQKTRAEAVASRWRQAAAAKE